jgi:hypothetical protein
MSGHRSTKGTAMNQSVQSQQRGHRTQFLASIANGARALTAAKSKPVWSQKAASGLLSGQELMEKMGAPPKFVNRRPNLTPDRRPILTLLIDESGR